MPAPSRSPAPDSSSGGDGQPATGLAEYVQRVDGGGAGEPAARADTDLGGPGGGAAPSRRATVPASRTAGWVERFSAGHGGPPALHRDPRGRPLLLAPDGTTAVCDLLVDDTDAYDDVPGLVAWVQRPHPHALVLVRRGGWAVALVEGTRVDASRVGTRYVQGRTKAGGWSQQRYARRRAQQADTVVGAAVAAATEMLRGQRRLVVTGGDRLLLRDTLAGLARTVPGLPVATRRLDVPDPRRRVLDEAAVAASAVRVAVYDALPFPGSAPGPAPEPATEQATEPAPRLAPEP